MIDPARLRAVCDQNNYMAPQISSDGTRWFCLVQQLFTVGIMHGTERDMEIGPAGRFCYHDGPAATQALFEWKARDFADKPLNYIVEK